MKGWVSRDLYEERERSHATQTSLLQDLVDRLSTDLALERDRFDRFAATVLAPSLSGNMGKYPTEPAIVAPVIPRPEPSPVSKVIREQASIGGRYDQALGTHLRAYAKLLKEQGLNEDAIVGKLVEWQTSESIWSSEDGG